MEKVTRVNPISDKTEVAILYNASYGSGWSTDAMEGEDPAILSMDKRFVLPILNKEPEKITPVLYEEVTGKQACSAFLSGVNNLRIFWVEQGEEFRISTYDGRETIVLYKHTQWHTA